MSVNMYGALAMHESAKCKDEEGNVGALATFVNVKPSDVAVVVDVVSNEKCSLENMENVFGGGGCRGSVCVDVVLVDLIEEDLCRIGIVDNLNLVRKDLLAFGWKVCMEVSVFVNNAGGGRSGKLWKKSGGKEEVWTGCNKPGLMVPWIVRSDRVELLAM